MINYPRIFKHPYNQQQPKEHMKTPSKKRRAVVKRKKSSPGVPPNTCPYIDVTQTMIKDLVDAYDRLYTTGEHNPMVNRIGTHAEETLEYVRNANETLRDNSLYWYEQFKKELKVK